MAPGIYKLYDRNRRIIYTGSSHQIGHRLEAVLYGRADYAQVPSKAWLRRAVRYYSVRYMGIETARKEEKKSKKNCRYNVG